MTDSEDRRIDRELIKDRPSNDPFAAAVRTTRMPMIVTDPLQPDNPIVFANAAFSKLTGYDRDEILGHNCRFLQGSATNKDDVARIRNAIARQEAIEIDLLNYRKDGTTFWNRLLISPVFDEEGKLRHFFASQFDVTPDRRRYTELQHSHGEMEDEVERRMLDLNASETRMRFILDSANMGVWTLDLASQRLIASAHCKANFGRAARDPFTYQDLQNSIDPRDMERWKQVIGKAVEEHGDFKIEYRIITPDSEERWVEVRGRVDVDVTDQPVSMAGISLDITERRQAEEHRKLLARELNHRVQNSLAMAQSVFAQSLRSATTIDQAREIAYGRIQALSTAQNLLTKDGFTSASIRDVVEQTLAPFNGGNLRIGGPKILLDAKAVSALSLALHELATNASKYGAMTTESGSVTISWEIERSETPQMRFHWSEMGGPPVKKPERRGFGSRVIEDTIRIELGGKAIVDYRPTGILYEIVAPLSEMEEGGDDDDTPKIGVTSMPDWDS